MADDRSLRVAGLFAGIGGFELGLHRAGHRTELLCEIDPVARKVLEAKEQFRGTEVVADVREIDRLDGIDLVTAGFPCQDLSQVGRRAGINGAKSSVVQLLFEILEKSDVPWVLVENVPFMLWLQRGAAIRYLVSEFERLGYAWAHRVIDTRAFGLPQRRQRVFLLASRVADPAPVLLDTDARPVADRRAADIVLDGQPIGFYWTEGNRGVGWTENGVPALKPGSGKGIPSPPAILFPTGFVGLPSVEDGERLQGFPAGWSEPAEEIARRRYRWKLVGNSVSVPVSRWLGRRLSRTRSGMQAPDTPLDSLSSWPRAAFGRAGERFESGAGPFPVRRAMTSLEDSVLGPFVPLSSGATAGFAARLARSGLSIPDGFLESLWAHADANHGWQG